MIRRSCGVVGVVAAAALLVGCGAAPAGETASLAGHRLPSPILRTPTPSTQVTAPALARVAATPVKPLAGVRVALDPGHQLGNRHFPRQINRKVPAGGFTKPCNTTGTATNSGYPEATLNFVVATLVRQRLQALGATVLMTRTSNSQRLWGPCVNVRGAFGAKVGADLVVSLHADGARAGARGFHIIVPPSRPPWTHDIAAASLRLAKALRGGLDARGVRRSTYVGRGTALSIRADLGTLNLSDIPIAMIELGNMRNAADARLMRSAKGRAVYASAVVLGIRTYLKR